MDYDYEIRSRQKHHLNVLLSIKKANHGKEVATLQNKIIDAVVVMQQEDVAWVEKVANINAL